MELNHCPIIITYSVGAHCEERKHIYTIDKNQGQEHYIVKHEDKTVKLTKRGVLIFFHKKNENMWEDLDSIEIKCSLLDEEENCGRELPFPIDPFEEDIDIQEKLNFFLDFQLETFL